LGHKSCDRSATKNTIPSLRLNRLGGCYTSIRKVAAKKDVSKGFVQKILKQKQTTGHVQPQQQGGSLKSVLNSLTNKLTAMVKKYPESIVVRIL